MLAHMQNSVQEEKKQNERIIGWQTERNKYGEFGDMIRDLEQKQRPYKFLSYGHNLREHVAIADYKGTNHGTSVKFFSIFTRRTGNRK